MAHDETAPKSNMLILVGIFSTLVLFITVVFLIVYFQHVSVDMFYARVESKPSKELQELRAIEDAKLNQYSWVDREKGIVRIPIEDAIRLEAKGSWRDAAQISNNTPIPETTQNTPARF